ncbi:reverse transcriptase domain-containing protein [Tanacetum coccineum]
MTCLSVHEFVRSTPDGCFVSGTEGLKCVIQFIRPRGTVLAYGPFKNSFQATIGYLNLPTVGKMIGCEILGSFCVNYFEFELLNEENPPEQSRLGIVFSKEIFEGGVIRILGFNPLVHSFCALSTLRRSGLRTASAAAKPCQGDSLEFYLITGSIYTDKRGTVVLATLFNEKSVRWPVLVIAILVSVVVSQAIISGTFSIINQSQSLGYIEP